MIRVRLLSWNLHGTPTAPRRVQRLARAAERVAAELPDIVLLQEVWRPGDAHRLVEALHPGYRPARHPDEGVWIRTSGLLAFVRRDSGWSLEGSSFRAFDERAPLWRLWEGDGLGRKGMQRIDVARAGQPLALFNTHLQAEYGPPRYARIREAQLAELASFAAGVAPDVPVLAAGDLNTRPDEAAYAKLTRSWRDLGAAARSRCGCGTRVDPDGREGGWIDYVLARRGRWRARARRFERIVSPRADDPYSDHHGLLVDVELRPGADAGLPLLGLVLGHQGVRLTRRRWLVLLLLLLGEGIGTPTV